MGEWSGGPLADEHAPARRVDSRTRFEGHVWDVRTDTVELADGQTVVRDVIAHTGAVGVIALDEHDRVLLIRQYRHPVGMMLWEPPAGLLDIAGEDPLHAVQRELFEETGHRAETWHVLVDFFNSPGGSDEAFRCYLARGVWLDEESERDLGHGEERDMPYTWLPLDQARDLVLAGRLHNPAAVAGVLAAWVSRAEGWTSLRPADTAWPERPGGSSPG